MKANSTKRKIFDAVDLLTEDTSSQMPVKTIVPVKYPQQFLFETENLLDDKIVIKLNVNHPFYQKVINPLCGDITEEEGAEEYNDKAKISVESPFGNSIISKCIQYFFRDSITAGKIIYCDISTINRYSE